MNTNRTSIDRRRFLSLTGGVALAGTAGLLLQACGGTAATPAGAPKPSAASSAPASSTAPPSLSAADKPSASAAAQARGGPYPTYIPFTNGPKPDFHDADPRYDDAYLNYPANPVKSWAKDPPGAGSKVNFLVNNYTLPPTPFDQDPTWKEVNKRINADVQFSITAAPDYPAKFGALMAGNDLPDIMNLYGGYAVANDLPAFFQAKCADLTPYLAGDAAKDYPNLAAIPTYAWRNSVSAINGKLYLLPLQRYTPGNGVGNGTGYIFKNTDLWDPVLGAGYAPKNADDFKKALVQLNRPKDGVYAFGNTVALEALGLAAFAQVFRAPNNWRLESSGKLTNFRETDEYKAAVSYVRDLWGMGLYHPDSQGPPPSGNLFIPRKAATSAQGYGNVMLDIVRRGGQQTPPNHYDLVPPFANDGGKPISYFGPGYISMNVLKQASPERIKELLRIIDYMAAPFGSQEQLLLDYGLAGQDYNIDPKGNPVPTPQGIPNAAYVPWKYIEQYPQVSYQPDLPTYAKTCWDWEHVVIPSGIDDPTWGFFSPTNFKSANANKAFQDGITDVMLGREPLSSYDTLAKAWVSAVGDQIRNEFMTAMQAAK